jgi:transcriptional regulator with XRE-family HTH domain
MSTDILSNSNTTEATPDKRTESPSPEALSEYVSRIMYEKRLTVREVEKRSGGRIAQSYVSRIAHGLCTNLTVEKAQALASGLEVDEGELFNVARRVPSSDLQGTQMDATAALIMLDTMKRIISDPKMLETIRELICLPPDALLSVEKLIKTVRENSGGTLEKTKQA